MKTSQTIKIDLLTPGARPRIHAVQDDICTREVKILLYTGGVNWLVLDGLDAAVGYSKPDGTVGLYDTLPDGSKAVSLYGNTVTVILAAQMLTAAGTVEAAVTLVDSSGNQISTFAFDVIVSANPGSNAVKSEDFFNYVNPKIQAVIEQAAAATTAANTAASRANASAELAEDAYELADTANQKVDTLREVVSKLHSNIVETASGEVITVSDSAEAPLQGLKVFGKTQQRTTMGKNLLNPDTVLPRSNVTVANGVVTQIKADSISNGVFKVRTLNTGLGVISSINGVALTTNGRMSLAFEKIGNVHYVLFGQNGDATDTTSYVDVSHFPDGWYTVSVQFTNVTQGSVSWCDMQIESGSAPTSYEPYTGGVPSPSPEYPQALESVGDGGSVTTTVCGKNLAKYSEETKEANGLTLVVNADKSVILNGTAETSSLIVLNNGLTIPAGQYIISGCPSGGSTATYDLRYGSTASNRDYGTGAEFTVSEETTLALSIMVRAGVTLSNLTFYPMIRPASIADDTYEPYKEAQALTISTPNSLPGIPVTSGGNYTDETGQQWICDEVDFEKGVYVQRISEVVLNDTISADKSSANQNGYSHYVVYASTGLMRHPESNGCPLLCSKFSTKPNGEESWGVVNTVFANLGNSGYYFVMDKTDVASAKAALVGTKILYARAETLYHPLTAEELTQYAALRTNYPNTTVYNDVGAHMEVKYVADTKLYVDNKFAELAGALVNNT